MESSQQFAAPRPFFNVSEFPGHLKWKDERGRWWRAAQKSSAVWAVFLRVDGYWEECGEVVSVRAPKLQELTRKGSANLEESAGPLARRILTRAGKL